MRDIRCLGLNGEECNLIDLPDHIWREIAAAPFSALLQNWSGPPERLRERLEIERIIRSFSDD